MLTKIMQWASVAALLLAVIFRPSGGYQILLEFVVSTGAVAVILQAVRTENYFCAAGFVAVALLFNPVLPVPLSQEMFLWLSVACVVAFLLSLTVFRTRPRFSLY